MPGEDTEKLEKTIVLDTSQYRSRIRKSNPTRSIINVAGFWDKHRNQPLNKTQKISFPMEPTNKKKELVGTLTYLAGGSGEVILARKYTTIGRHPTSDVVVKGLFMGLTAVTISQMSDGFHLCHVGGITKPKVNQKTVKQSITLKNEDIIAIGSTRLQFAYGNSSNS